MAHVTREEILKIAQMSYLDIHEDEIEHMVQQVDQVLSYAVRVQEIASRVDELDEQDFESANVNIFREDVVIPTDSAPILEQAPEREGTYFVVPRILETNE